MIEFKQQLKQIRKDMPVYDNTGKKFGKVTFVHTGATEYVGDWNTNLNDNIPPVVFDELPREFPQEVNDRLLQNGFVKVKTGILFGTRYVLPDYIEEVRSGEVHLSVGENDIP